MVAFLSCVCVYWDEINSNREGNIIMNMVAARIILESAAKISITSELIFLEWIEKNWKHFKNQIELKE